MKMMQDGVEAMILPETAVCLCDEECRSPLDISECPIGCEVCTGDCYYYTEDEPEAKCDD